MRKFIAVCLLGLSFILLPAYLIGVLMGMKIVAVIWMFLLLFGLKIKIGDSHPKEKEEDNE